jgi:DNA-binding response OmpR family regulator
MDAKFSLLLVESKAFGQHLLETELVDAGFEVVVAHSGREALHELRTNAPRFCAVITDVKPNELHGWGLAWLARELIQSIPVIYLSGGPRGDWESKGVPNSIFVADPVTPSRIVTTISALLNSAGKPAPSAA